MEGCPPKKKQQLYHFSLVPTVSEWFVEQFHVPSQPSFGAQLHESLILSACSI